MIKLIALDLDGTLIKTDQTISKKNKKAIRRCIDMGILVSIHTGRCAASVRETIKELDLKGYHASSSGASLINESLELCFIKRMPGKAVRDISLECRRLGIPFIGQTGDSLISFEEKYPELENMIESSAFFSHVPDMTADGIVQNILQITLFLNDGDPRNIILKEKFEGELKFRRAGKMFVNIIDNSAGKLTGLKKVMEISGVKREEVMAMGDTEVDLGIINFAGTGVAMENSPDSVKKAADFISSHFEEDGVAHAIERFVFNQGIQ